jgi:hypothetical protein
MAMSDQEIIQNGVEAETLLNDDGFNHLFETTQNSLSQQILATAPHDIQTREQLFYTYQGMRAFIGNLGQMVSAKDNVLAMREAKDAASSNE